MATPRSSSVATWSQPSTCTVDRRGHDGDHQAERPEGRPLEEHDQRDRRDADQQGPTVEASRMEQGVERPDHAIGALGRVAGEVGQLPQHDVDADGVDEPDHDGVGDEAQDRAEPQEPGHQHDHPGQDRQGDQGPGRITGFAEGTHIGDQHRHRPGPLHRHERRARAECPGHRADHVAVEAGQRVDPGQQPGGEAVGNRLHAEHQTGDGVLTQGTTTGAPAVRHLPALLRHCGSLFVDRPSTPEGTGVHSGHGQAERPADHDRRGALPAARTRPTRSREFRRDAAAGPGADPRRRASSSTATTPARRRACRAGPRCSPGSTRRCTACRRPTAWPSSTTTPAMRWLDPDAVPTLGDWFRAGGYQTHYRGKWHVSHADLPIPGSHEGLMASDDDGRPIAEAVEAYRRADRLDPFGFSGWIGREPHGAAKSDCGTVRDGVFAEQVVDLFGDLAGALERRAVAGGRVVREPARHRLRRRLLRAAARASTRPTTPCPTSPRRRRSPTRSPGARPARSSSRTLWPQMVADAAGRRRLPAPLLLPAQAGRSGRSAASSTRSTRRAWPTTRSSCSPPTTATCSAPTAACSRSGPTRSTRRPACRCSSGAPASRRSPAGITMPTSHVDLIPTLHGPRRHRRRARRRRRRRAPHRGPPAARPRPQRPGHRPAPRRVGRDARSTS